jgi:hypothetical protein
MKYAVEMTSVAVIYIPSCINIDSGIQKLMRGYTDHRQHQDRISLLWENRLKICIPNWLSNFKLYYFWKRTVNMIKIKLRKEMVIFLSVTSKTTAEKNMNYIICLITQFSSSSIIT